MPTTSEQIILLSRFSAQQFTRESEEYDESLPFAKLRGLVFFLPNTVFIFNEMAGGYHDSHVLKTKVPSLWVIPLVRPIHLIGRSINSPIA